MSRRPALLNSANHEPLTFEVDGKVLDAFLFDDSPVGVIQGPIGSGKTRAALMRMIRHCSEQPVQRDKKRHSRWLVVRQTYPELKTTTIKAFLETFPEGQFGHMNWSPPCTYYFSAGDVEAEFIFLALENEDDVKKLRSLECTGIYFNELQYVGLDIFSEADSRVGRFPSVKDGGCTWTGVIADMNAPESLHWVPIMFGLTPLPDHFNPEQIEQHRRPEGWNLFVQPPAVIELNDALKAQGIVPLNPGSAVEYAVNPKAENQRWLREGYYAKQIKGKLKSWIDANLRNKPASLVHGKAVHPLFNADIHVARQPLRYLPEYQLEVGLDFGLTPAAIVGQKVGRRVFLLAEFYMEDAGAVTFAPYLASELIRRFPDINLDNVKFWGDPGGNIRGQDSEKTSYDIFWEKARLRVIAAPGANRFRGESGRKEVVDNLLDRSVDGNPALLADPSMRLWITGMQGGYQFKEVKTASGFYASGDIVKNRYSHPCEAGQYLFLGMGEGGRLLYGEGKRPAPVQTRSSARVFDRGRRSFGGRR
jgi:hypothetical protein